MMAIVSKAVFEKAAGKSPAVGTRLGMDRYVSANKNLEPLGAGGKLYLVTVRPPDEALWLVAVLDNPAFDGTQWTAAPSTTPITDVSNLRARIKFTSGAGITAKAGALGMSLQTPRALTAEDVQLLDAAVGGAADAGVPAAPAGPSAFGAATGERRGSLLGAILEDPGSDAARQVYADQLIANDDPRGELILVDIALAGPLSIRKREQLAARRRELIEAHAATWWPYTAMHWRVSRGFLEAVTGSLEQLQQVGGELFAREPITDVTVHLDDPEDVGTLLKAPWFPRIRHLVLRGEVYDDGFATLVKSKRAANLRGLNVSARELTADGLGALTTGLPACTHLVLTGNGFGDEGAGALARWKHLPAIETLYLSTCELTADGVRELLGGKPLGALAKLCLNANPLDDDGAGVIAGAATRLPALRHLELRRTGISESGAQAIARALPWLRRVDVRHNGLDEEAPARDRRIRAA